MQISSRFSVAVHIISLLKLYGNPMLTSDYIAGSVNTNPVVVRRILGMLKKSGFVAINRGNGGAYLIKDIKDITMLDLYRSVSEIEKEKLLNETKLLFFRLLFHQILFYALHTLLFLKPELYSIFDYNLNRYI